jgi:lipopolysaccharide biosynthesis regulator YciM
VFRFAFCATALRLMDVLLWLLLPVAAVSGWMAASRFRVSSPPPLDRAALRSDYFRGIDYLLNEQPDKAVEAFIRVLEVDAETVETHLSLGNLYRRRGEVDRAIRVHQNLISTATNAEHRAEAMLELGQDYLSAGLLDRAEDLFLELVEEDSYRVQALRQLIEIYEQEKDWTKAINAARQLENVTGNQLGSVIANYWCEVAELARADGELDRAQEHVAQALATHTNCARASILEGDFLAEQGLHAQALDAYRRVATQDAALLPEVVGRMQAAAVSGNLNEKLVEYLHGMMIRHGGVSVTLALAELMESELGGERARAFMTEQVKKRPTLRGFSHLMSLEVAEADALKKPHLAVLRDLSVELLADRPVFKCSHCGFPGRSLHWQCPGCKHWNSVKPIQGVEGE